VNPRLQRLRAEVASDLDAFRQRVDDLRSVVPKDAASCALVAVALHHAYGAVESAFLRLSRIVDATDPMGQKWHQELLTAMAMAIPEVRQAWIAVETRDRLHELLAFRHFFRHAYAVALSAERLAEVRTTTLELAPILERDFARIDGLLAALAREH
jgi:hypothetical protein